jgi:hypothetical protein
MTQLNPYIRDTATIENLTAGILLTVNRLAQVCRSCGDMVEAWVGVWLMLQICFIAPCVR